MIAILLAVFCLVGSDVVIGQSHHVFSTSPKPPVCMDEPYMDCAYYKKFKLCFVMGDLCKKTCGNCVCKDDPMRDCAFYKKHDLCMYVSHVCKKTCGECPKPKTSMRPPTPSKGPQSTRKPKPKTSMRPPTPSKGPQSTRKPKPKTSMRPPTPSKGPQSTRKPKPKTSMRPPTPSKGPPSTRKPKPKTSMRPATPSKGPSKPRPTPPTPGGKCGISSVQQARIIAGVDAKKGAWPWIASMTIEDSSTKSYSHFCGGSLIHPEWVLTAAHCVDNFDKKNKNQMATFKIGLGIHNRSNLDSSAQYIGVKDFFIHHTWANRNDIDWHDIALVQLKRPALLSKRVTTVCLPGKNSKPKKNAVCYLAGWGTVQHPGNIPEVLQQAFMPVVNESHCFHSTHMICTGYGKTSKINACRGDSGGPLMCRNNNGSWTVHGIASFVVEYCKYYTAFADAGVYLDWIRKYVPV